MKTNINGISFIIPAYNEEDLLIPTINHLHKILTNLKLPFEIIVVNDRSEDDTGFILNEYTRKNKLIRVLTISDCELGLSPKKNALSQGINMSTGNIIITTDADCHVPELWLKTMLSYFTPTIFLFDLIPKPSTVAHNT